MSNAKGMDNDCDSQLTECETTQTHNQTSQHTEEKKISQPPTETANIPVTATTTEGETQEESQTKIDLLLKATGNAPIMKRKKWLVEKVKKISYVIEFVKKYLRCDPSESLFLYVNQSFAPSPDTDIGTLYDCFGSDGKLVLHYCKTQAWG